MHKHAEATNACTPPFSFEDFALAALAQDFAKFELRGRHEELGSFALQIADLIVWRRFVHFGISPKVHVECEKSQEGSADDSNSHDRARCRHLREARRGAAA